MRRLVTTSVLALAAIAALAGSAWAAPAPVISSVSPTQVAIGGTLTIKGKNFKKGVKNNRVFFIRSDGKTVRARPSKANSTRQMSVKVPAALEQFLTVKDGVATATRFHVQVLSGRFSKKTSTSRSPLIFPASSTPTPGSPNTPGGTTTPPPPPDCDSDGTPDASDTDDDNDGLSDDLEAQIKTNPCAKDTDGDGVEDGYEYWSARDLNGNAIPYAGKRPFPNALDASDGAKDFDGDGLTQTEEFQAWNLYGGRVLPTGDGQTFPYSDGNQTSPAPANSGGRDFDLNGKVTDEEKDADDDGIANWLELGKGAPLSVDGTLAAFGNWHNGANCTFVVSTDGRFSDCGGGTVGNGNTYTKGSFASYFLPNWLDPDSDGDGIKDGADDSDHDDVSDVAELAGGSLPVDPCSPDPNSRTCQQH